MAVVAVEGEHDLYTAPSLREQVEALLDEGVSVVVDLTEATFVDSSILGVLVAGRQQAADLGLGFAVALAEGGTAAVRRILEVTGLTPVLPVLPARDAAVQAARSGGPPA